MFYATQYVVWSLAASAKTLEPGSNPIKTPIQLFRRLLQQQTLSVDNEERSLALLYEWLDDIGRLDIVQDIKKHSRPVKEGVILFDREVHSPRGGQHLLRGGGGGGEEARRNIHV